MRNYDLYPSPWIDSLRDLLDKAASTYGDKTAICNISHTGEFTPVTYTKLRSDVAVLGSLFASRGCITGHKIVLVGENSYEWIVSYLAVVNIGAVVIPMDKELAPEDMAELVKTTGVNLVLHTDGYKEAAAVIAAAAEPSPQTLSIDSEAFTNLITKGSIEYSRNPALYERIVLAPRDNPAAILFTSGTTGTSKGVMLSHLNIATNVNAAASMVNFTSKDIVLSVLPMHHAYELTCGILAALHCGCTVFINDNMKHLVRNIGLVKPTGMFVVPLILETMYKKITLEARRTKQETKMKIAAVACRVPLAFGKDIRAKVFKSIHNTLGGRLFKIVCGGAPLDPVIVAAFRNFGVNVLQGYGITECSPLVSVNRNRFHRDASVGLPVPCNEVSIQDGEICVRGSNVMLGYYKNKQATEDAFYGNWFHTGDLGEIDKNGFLHITGRKKNLIVSTGGKNIYPEEIEERLLRSDAIAEVVVRGEMQNGLIRVVAEILPDFDMINDANPDAGEAVAAAVKKVNAQLPSYKQIADYTLRTTEFVKTTTKKIKRIY